MVRVWNAEGDPETLIWENGVQMLRLEEYPPRGWTFHPFRPVPPGWRNLPEAVVRSRLEQQPQVAPAPDRRDQKLFCFICEKYYVANGAEHTFSLAHRSALRKLATGYMALDRLFQELALVRVTGFSELAEEQRRAGLLDDCAAIQSLLPAAGDDHGEPDTRGQRRQEGGE